MIARTAFVEALTLAVFVISSPSIKEGELIAAGNIGITNAVRIVWVTITIVLTACKLAITWTALVMRIFLTFATEIINLWRRDAIFIVASRVSWATEL